MKLKLRSLCASLGLMTIAGTASADDLLQIYQQALASDPIVIQAKADRDRLYESIRENRSVLLPTISGNIGYDKAWGDTRGGFSGFTGGLTLNQVIYDHAAWVGLSLAEKAASQADATYASALQQLITRVAQAYFDVLTAQDRVEFLEAEKRAIGRQLEQTKQRFAVGLTAITGVHEAQAQFDLATANLITAENELENSYEVLREITGIDHKDLNVLDTDRFSAGKPTPANSNEWLTIAEDSNLSLMERRLGKDIAQENISLAKAGHLPSVNFQARATTDQQRRFPTGISGLESANDQNIAVTMSVPLFEGFRVDSRVKQAQFNYVIASEALEQTHRLVVKNVRSNFNTVNATVSSIRAFEQSVISAESALKATQAGFEVGTRTIVEVLNRTRDLFNAKTQLSNSRYAYILSILQLKAAAGTLNEDDVIAVNNGLRPQS
ncbi:outer membrane channel protein TolC [Paraferrimonas sedimenticola]|uniref:Outer membrane channel protein TolC n=1 Tax=Paraferrimonas sedimenticola TaxID=375674 RepID=A0AA37RYW7_9GAMM|nr:outer membrane channel protein TolC [Paraferrimonas sedimenticola]GLP97232.1 outer membrane channel protein TolC [Paraferrimonas sedimenticola]